MLERIPPKIRTVLRVAAGIAVAIAAGRGAMILLFLGFVTAVDCFIQCGSGPNLVEGGLLLAGGALCASLSLTSLVWAAIGWDRPALSRVAVTVAGLTTVVMLVVLVAV